jgi:hypothetical protein
MTIDGSNRVQLIGDKSGNSAVNVLALNGVAGNTASAPDAAYYTNGDIDVRIDLAANDYTPSGAQVLKAKRFAGSGQASWQFVLDSTGVLQITYSTDGSTLVAMTSTASVSASDFERINLRATLDVDNGAGGKTAAFYTRAAGLSLGDNTGWVQLGTSVTTAGTITLFNGTDPVYIGGLGGVATAMLNGIVYSSWFSNSIDGTAQLFPVFTAQPKLATSFTESSSNAATVTINTTGDLGARICGARDLVQMTASKMPQYLAWAGSNYGYLNGVAGNYFISPDSAAVSITGDIDIRAYVALADWTPSTPNVLLSKSTSGGQSSFQIYINTDGRLRGSISRDGTVATVSDVGSTSPLSVSDLGSLWVRFTRASADGAYVLYTSTDGSTWSNVGSGSTTAGSLFDSTALVLVGANSDVGTGSFRMSGLIYRAQIYNGINGTLAFDFNPATYTSGTTFLDSSSNAATITLNGGSTIVTRTCLYFDGTDDYMKAASFALAQPLTRYAAASQVSWTSGDYLWDGAAAANGAALIQTTSTPQLNINAGTSTAANTGLSTNTISVITEVFNTTTSLLQIKRNSSTGGNAGSGTPNGITIGASGASTAANFSNMTLSEMIVYAVEQDMNIRNLIITYLGMVWRILLS